MTILPEEFTRTVRAVMGEERFSRYIEAFDGETPVSIRLNTRIMQGGGAFLRGRLSGEQFPRRVPWCQDGYYLAGRPQFTFDPLFHAGCYYVQEAASMFVSHVLRSLVCEPVAMLDLCAAPGGKSTAAIAALPPGSTLVSNEPVPARAQALLENITKWGWAGCTVTNNYPRDFRNARRQFDVILCDVPCSGEGMFRKDAMTIGEWSLQNVEKCWRLQREIVAEAWECLAPGGLLIYSTCTFNLKENEENVRWILQTYDAAPLTIPTAPEWGITGSLLAGFELPVYRFIPGITRSEGLFMAVLRKGGHKVSSIGVRAEERGRKNDSRRGQSLKVISIDFPASTLYHELTYSDALRYLRGEALTLPPDTPRGIVTVGYHGVPLGPVKNVGSRANNLYPKPWRIKSTHLPPAPPRILEELKNWKIEELKKK